jgi:glutathione S-transferase
VNRLVALALGAAEKYVVAYYERNTRPDELIWPAWLDRIEGQVQSGLSALDGMVGAPWCAGETFTQADICVTVALWAMRFDMPHLAPPGRFPGLDAIAAEAEMLDAFAATRPR